MICTCRYRSRVSPSTPVARTPIRLERSNVCAMGGIPFAARFTAADRLLSSSGLPRPARVTPAPPAPHPPPPPPPAPTLPPCAPPRPPRAALEGEEGELRSTSGKLRFTRKRAAARSASEAADRGRTRAAPRPPRPIGLDTGRRFPPREDEGEPGRRDDPKPPPRGRRRPGSDFEDAGPSSPSPIVSTPARTWTQLTLNTMALLTQV